MQEQVSKNPSGNKGQYLSFHLGAEDYAVDILRVQEIRGWEKVRTLPDSEDYVKGVLDLRGTIVPIIDLRVRFGESNPEYSATTVVIVMAIDLGESHQQLVGAVVDGVSDVLDINRSDLKPPPDIGGTVSRRYLEGMVSLPRGMVILLNLDKLFNPREMARLRDLGCD
ncbi:MAG: purine-binding chemotaxis protein CheW [Gammaproteobacteria bacterium]|nr:purine-binding chemotaxis protein CheW [Gammaproteobacteria bacterium]